MTTETGIAIPGAVVETYEQQAITASEGSYLLSGIPAGDYRVTARAAGLEPQVKEAVRVFPGRITDNINFVLTQASDTPGDSFKIVSINPSFGTDGDIIHILGTGFGTVQGRVTIAGKECEILAWNTARDGVLIIRLPDEVETGWVKVYINGVESSEQQPLTFIARPIALSAEPQSAQAGSTVSITGRNFHQVGSFNKVFLNGLACQVLNVPTTRMMQILLPQNAETGPFVIRIEGDQYQLDGISTAMITILPELVYISPKRSVQNIPLTLYGRNFGSDKNAVKVLVGQNHIIQPADILSHSKTRIIITAPSGDVVAPGKSTTISVSVNDFASNQLAWTSYDTALTTLSDYGIYNFTQVSTGNTLHLATFPSNDKIAFISVLSGNGSVELGGFFQYGVSAYLGGNFTAIPDLPPAATCRPAKSRHTSASERLRPVPCTNLSASITDPAPATITVWLKDFTASNPEDPNNDLGASGTLSATGTNCLVYLDNDATTVLTATEAEIISEWFDNVYATVATACWDGKSDPPEGNIDGQPRILIYMTPFLDSSAANIGYFRERDKSPLDEHSMGTEILYFAEDSFSAGPEALRAAMARELHQMMYFNQKGLEGIRWLSAGLAEFAQQSVGYGLQQGFAGSIANVSDFLHQPHRFSISNWASVSEPGNVGLSYLFVQYMYERCGEYQAIRTLENRNGAIGFTDIENNVLFSGLTQPATNSLQDFIHEFFLALYCDGLNLPGSLPNYNAQIHGFTTLDLRGSFAGVSGLKHLAFDENPVIERLYDIMGYGCDVIEYHGGNGGDLEVSISGPTAGNFKTWVIYYPAQ